MEDHNEYPQARKRADWHHDVPGAVLLQGPARQDAPGYPDFQAEGRRRALPEGEERGTTSGHTHVDPRSGAIPFSQVAEEWQKSNNWLDLKETSKARYASVLRVHLLPRWGERQIGSIRRGDVDEWVAELRQAMPPGTVRKVHSTFRATLSFAVFKERLNTNPAVGVKLPRVPHRDIDRLFLDEEEVNALAHAVPSRYRSVILLAAWGGLRAGEIWGLKRRWLDVETGKLTVAETLVTVHGQGLVWTTTKTHERRIVSLPRFLCEALDTHLREFTEPGPDAIVFTDPNGLAQGQTAFAQDVFKPAVRAVLSEDKRGLRFHDLRHTAASLMIAHDLSPKFISDQLGHRDIGITFNRYGHLWACPDPVDTSDVSDRGSTR